MGVNSSSNYVNVKDKKLDTYNDLCNRPPFNNEYLVEEQYRRRPILRPEVWKNVLDFLWGKPLMRTFELSPLAFISSHEALNLLTKPIDEAFEEAYGNFLSFSFSRIEWTPIETCERGMRYDKVMLAKVNSRKLVGSTVKIGYTCQYQHEITEEKQKKKREGGGSNPAAPTYESSFLCDILPLGAKRSIWVHKDITKFHGDDIRVAALQPVLQANEGDFLEISVTLFSKQGLIDPSSVRFKPLAVLPTRTRPCPIEDEVGGDWYDRASYQAQTMERLDIPKVFSNSMRSLRNDFSGIDIVISRCIFEASKPGPVGGAEKVLGTRFEVHSLDMPIIVSLKKAGLLHDRFTKITMREGDRLWLYVSQGGKAS